MYPTQCLLLFVALHHFHGQAADGAAPMLLPSKGRLIHKASTGGGVTKNRKVFDVKATTLLREKGVRKSTIPSAIPVPTFHIGNQRISSELPPRDRKNCGIGFYFSIAHKKCLGCWPAGSTCTEPKCCCGLIQDSKNKCIAPSCEIGDEKKACECDKGSDCHSKCCVPGQQGKRYCREPESCEQKPPTTGLNQVGRIFSPRVLRPGDTPTAKPLTTFCPGDLESKDPHRKVGHCCTDDSDCRNQEGKGCCSYVFGCEGKCAPCHLRGNLVKRYCPSSPPPPPKINRKICKVDDDCPIGSCCTKKKENSKSKKCRKCPKQNPNKENAEKRELVLKLILKSNTLCRNNSDCDHLLTCTSRKERRVCDLAKCKSKSHCSKLGECCRLLDSEQVCVPCPSEQEGRSFSPVDDTARTCKRNKDCGTGECCKNKSPDGKGVCSACLPLVEDSRQVPEVTEKPSDGKCIVGRDCPLHACCAKRKGENVCRKCKKNAVELKRCRRDSDCKDSQCCVSFGLGNFCDACRDPTPPPPPPPPRPQPLIKCCRPGKKRKNCVVCTVPPPPPEYKNCSTDANCPEDFCCAVRRSTLVKSCIPRPQLGAICLVDSSDLSQFVCSCGEGQACVELTTTTNEKKKKKKKKKATSLNEVGACRMRPETGKTKKRNDKEQQKQEKRPEKKDRKRGRKTKN